MPNILVVLPLFLLLLFGWLGCQSNTNSAEAVVRTMNQAFNERDFDLLRETLHPNLKVVESTEEIVASNREDYFSYFVLYSEAFGTKWTIHEMEEKGDWLETVEGDSSSLYDFMYGRPLNMRYTYQVRNNQIVELHYVDLPGNEKLNQKADKKMEEFYQWVEKRDPRQYETITQPSVEGAKMLHALMGEFEQRKEEK
ncbi:MAG: nuclear transport factor 2 family protein [Bacteroidota bacterium]